MKIAPRVLQCQHWRLHYNAAFREPHLLEKSDRNTMNHFHKKKTSKVIATWLLSIALVWLTATPASGQVRSGGAFLKVLPGARHQGMAGSLTGVIDELNALYANPGATGFLRPWQWS